MRVLAEALLPHLRELLAEPPKPTYYDQRTSPLGAERHKRLCREGALPYKLEGKRYLVTADAMDEHLTPERPVTPQSDEHLIRLTISRLAQSRRG